MEMSQGERAAVKQVTSLWWLWVVLGVAWTIVGLVILQFDQASVTTVGVIIGIMFISAGAQNLAIAAIADRLRWLFAIFGILFVACGVISFISPENTFAAVADVLGFLFLVVGVFWTITAFATKEDNELWWLGLVGGILMIVLAFWTAGQFFIDKAYVLLVFAGAWALMSGIIDIIRGFQIRKLGKLV